MQGGGSTMIRAIVMRMVGCYASIRQNIIEGDAPGGTIWAKTRIAQMDTLRGTCYSPGRSRACMAERTSVFIRAKEGAQHGSFQTITPKAVCIGNGMSHISPFTTLWKASSSSLAPWASSSPVFQVLLVCFALPRRTIHTKCFSARRP